MVLLGQFIVINNEVGAGEISSINNNTNHGTKSNFKISVDNIRLIVYNYKCSKEHNKLYKGWMKK